jgi:hypothetical protein
MTDDSKGNYGFSAPVAAPTIIKDVGPNGGDSWRISITVSSNYKQAGLLATIGEHNNKFTPIFIGGGTLVGGIIGGIKTGGAGVWPGMKVGGTAGGIAVPLLLF